MIGMPGLKLAAKRFLPLALLGLLLTGCATTVSTKVNAFRAEAAEFGAGTVAVRAANESVGQSLEFAHYRVRLEAALADLGYTPVNRFDTRYDSPDYEAHIAFDVDEGSVRNSRLRPGFAETRIYPHHRGFGFGPSMSVVVLEGAAEQALYTHRLSLVISKPASGERVYEVKGVTQSQCGVFSVIYDEMLESMLKNFPADNGSVQDVRVKGDARC